MYCELQLLSLRKRTLDNRTLKIVGFVVFFYSLFTNFAQIKKMKKIIFS